MGIATDRRHVLIRLVFILAAILLALTTAYSDITHHWSLDLTSVDNITGVNSSYIPNAGIQYNSTDCVYGECMQCVSNRDNGINNCWFNTTLTAFNTTRTGAVSLSFWVLVRTYSADTPMLGTLTGVDRNVISSQSNNVTYIDMTPPAVDQTITGVPLNDTWTHYVFSITNVTNGNLTVYVDGQHRRDVSNANLFNPTEPLSYLFFTYRNEMNPHTVEMDGNIDEIWLFNETLNNTEARALYHYNDYTRDVVFMDNCTLYNYTFTTFFSRDESTGALINANASYDFTYNRVGSAEVKSYSALLRNKNEYTFCRVIDNLPIEADITYTYEAAGYKSRTFVLDDYLITGNITAYLLEEGGNSQQVTYTLIDTADEAVSGARVQIYRSIDGNSTLVHSGVSDVAGQVSLFQDSTVLYSYVVNHTDFPIREFDLVPISTTYNIRLTPVATTFTDTAYSGIRYRLTPSGTILNITGENISFKFELQGSNLEYFGINITGHPYDCFPDSSCSNVSTSSTGGEVTVNVQVNSTDSADVSLWYKKVNEDIVYINHVPTFFVLMATQNIVNWFTNLRNDTGALFRTILAAAISIVVVGVAAHLGVFGGGLVIVASLVNVGLSLPQVGLINPLVGLTMSVFGFAVGTFLMLEQTR